MEARPLHPKKGNLSTGDSYPPEYLDRSYWACSHGCKWQVQTLQAEAQLHP